MRKGTLKELVETVEGHYAGGGEPLLLSRLGQILTGVGFRGFGGLKAAIQAAGGDRLVMLNPSGTPGEEAVALPGEVQGRIAEVLASQSARVQAARDFDALPVPVRLAFCIGASGEQVALSLRPPFRYARLPRGAAPALDQRIVEESFRHPGLYLRSASEEEREQLWKSFLAWSDRHGLSPDRFSLGPVTDDLTNALDRLVLAQDVDIRARLRVPDDIAGMLRSLR